MQEVTMVTATPSETWAAATVRTAVSMGPELAQGLVSLRDAMGLAE